MARSPPRHRAWTKGGGWPVSGLAIVPALIAAWLAGPPAAGAQEPVFDAAIVLAVDCSYSVDQEEFELQRGGLAQAFREPEIVEAIRSGANGRIVISLVEWSDADSQVIVIPWTVVSGPAEAEALADRIGAMPRKLGEGGTAITAIMRFAGGMLLDAPFRADRYVIDISSDGRNNTGGNPRLVRDQLAAAGITINGLTILNEVPTLNYYFERTIVGGPAYFVVVANDYAGYREAVLRKLLREITAPQLSGLPQGGEGIP
ncbi:DUF1194 domain-containing protein [Kaustia mangrovi]|uniref:DUF1194 domain-containing protein n=1 Tax=Kaustia mangrovi TaxID=2593653 RepID=A0A7S8C1Z1_9HYPH|nr:DUF1194 domain-containing protein [Kaustia mangrovi]QPC41899.1 DUF1194 domain-containing protein [Kaustia mangrovi]